MSWFPNAMVALFIHQAFVHPIFGDLAIWAETVSVPSGPHLSDLGLLASTVLAAVFVMAGIYRIRKDRLSSTSEPQYRCGYCWSRSLLPIKSIWRL